MSAGQVYLRNRDPTHRLAVPLGNGWARILPPQTCTSVPVAVLRSAGVAAGLAAERLAVVTEVSASSSPDARAAAALRRDMAAAIARAEQAEFDKLRAGMAPMRGLRWRAERLERIRQSIANGASMKQIAAEHGLTRQAIDDLCRRHGLLAGQRPHSDRRPV